MQGINAKAQRKDKARRKEGKSNCLMTFGFSEAFLGALTFNFAPLR